MNINSCSYAKTKIMLYLYKKPKISHSYFDWRLEGYLRIDHSNCVFIQELL